MRVCILGAVVYTCALNNWLHSWLHHYFYQCKCFPIIRQRKCCSLTTSWTLPGTSSSTSAVRRWLRVLVISSRLPLLRTRQPRKPQNNRMYTRTLITRSRDRNDSLELMRSLGIRRKMFQDILKESCRCLTLCRDKVCRNCVSRRKRNLKRQTETTNTM